MVAPMSSQEPISARQAELLRAVCREYLLSGHEVASAALARGSGWSSATMRNELAALERRGFVVRPHRSAGCRPTLPGLEHYVRSLPVAASPRPELARAVDRSLDGETSSPEQSVRAAVHLLAEVTGCVAVSFIGDARAGVVESLEVVPIMGSRALVVLGFHAGSTSVHPVQVDLLAERGSDPAADLLRLQARLRQLCIGHTLEQAHAEITHLQSDAESRVDRLLAEAVRIGLAVCTLGAFDPLWLYVAGQSSLARELAHQVAHATVRTQQVANATGRTNFAEIVADVLTPLEDYRRLADVLCQLLPAPGGHADPRAEVLLGTSALLASPHATSSTASAGDRGENDDAPLRLAVVGCRLPAESEPGAGATGAPSTRAGARSHGVVRMGAVALLGVDRMDYAEVVPLVEYAAKALAARTCA
jgi:heat-inducible transcriptional repressor